MSDNLKQSRNGSFVKFPVKNFDDFRKYNLMVETWVCIYPEF